MYEKNLNESGDKHSADRKEYSTPRLYMHGSLEKITESVMLPTAPDSNMAGCAQGA
jgi:hypothetical protein